MANGDVAALYGFTPVASTDDIRLGYDRVNQLADLLMQRTGANAWSLAPLTLTTGTTNGWGSLADPNGATSGTLQGGVKLLGGLLIGSFQCVYTGTTAVTANSNGNIADTTLGTLAAGFRPGAPRVFSYSMGGVAQGAGNINPNGTIVLQTLDPNNTLSGGTTHVDFVVPM